MVNGDDDILHKRKIAIPNKRERNFFFCFPGQTIFSNALSLKSVKHHVEVDVDVEDDDAMFEQQQHSLCCCADVLALKLIIEILSFPFPNGLMFMHYHKKKVFLSSHHSHPNRNRIKILRNFHSSHIFLRSDHLFF